MVDPGELRERDVDTAVMRERHHPRSDGRVGSCIRCSPWTDLPGGCDAQRLADEVDRLRAAITDATRAARADAWVEGYNASAADHRRGEYRPNPYRQRAERDGART